MATKGFSWGKVRPTSRRDRSAVLVIPNVNIRMEAQHSIPPLSLHDDLRDSFTLRYVLYVVQGVTFGYIELARSSCAPVGNRKYCVTMDVIVIA
jgi:hypothetical protein